VFTNASLAGVKPDIVGGVVSSHEAASDALTRPCPYRLSSPMSPSHQDLQQFLVGVCVSRH
jgi:hypothetical protein